MNNRLIIVEDLGLALVYKGDTLFHIYMEHKIYPTNKIYIGKISNILPALGAAFVQLDRLKEKNGFLHFNRLKKEESGNWLQNSCKRRHLLVQITREPIGNKGPTVSTNIYLKGKYLTLSPFQRDTYQQKKNIQLYL